MTKPDQGVRQFFRKAVHWCHRNFGYPIVRCGTPNPDKRALLIYLSQGLRWKEDDTRFRGHQNYRQSRQIAYLLAQRGYWVDVVQYDDVRFVPRSEYSLSIIHPGKVEKRLRGMKNLGFKLCLRTGKHSAFVDQAVSERYEMLEQRRGVRLDWNGTAENNSIYEGYDAIACFDGNGSTATTFEETGLPVYPFRNYANPEIQYIGKDFKRARNGFIYIASQLHISKGLDWLIELFAENPELDLYICGKIPAEIQRVYERELSSPNIRSLGYTYLFSNKFRALCEKAAWYISPSATEGCSGAVLDAMASGLVPVISKACSVDTQEAGLDIDPCTPEALSRIVVAAASLGAEEIEKRSRLARSVAEQRYASGNFTEDWSSILDRIEEGVSS